MKKGTKTNLWDAAFRKHTLVRVIEPTDAMKDSGTTMLLITGRFIEYGKQWVQVTGADGDYGGKLLGDREVEVLS
jgi:hypothetical protein